MINLYNYLLILSVPCLIGGIITGVICGFLFFSIIGR